MNSRLSSVHVFSNDQEQTQCIIDIEIPSLISTTSQIRPLRRFDHIVDSTTSQIRPLRRFDHHIHFIPSKFNHWYKIMEVVKSSRGDKWSKLGWVTLQKFRNYNHNNLSIYEIAKEMPILIGMLWYFSSILYIPGIQYNRNVLDQCT